MTPRDSKKNPKNDILKSVSASSTHLPSISLVAWLLCNMGSFGQSWAPYQASSRLQVKFYVQATSIFKRGSVPKVSKNPIHILSTRLQIDNSRWIFWKQRWKCISNQSTKSNLYLVMPIYYVKSHICKKLTCLPNP